MKMRRAIVAFWLAVSLSACAAVPVRSPIRGEPPPMPPLGHERPEVPLSPQGDATGSQDSITRTIEFAPKSEEESRSKDGKPLPLPQVKGKMVTGLIGPTLPRELVRPSISDQEKQKIILNFDKADISEVTNQIFGDYLKINYVLDPALQGRISLYLEGEYTKEELFQLVSRVYEANNISVVPRKGIYYIQPVQRSTSSNLPLAGVRTLGDDQTGTRPVAIIYRLRYLDAKQAINLIQPFLSPGRTIKSDNLTNSVVFVENAENAQTIVEVLKAMDINVLQEVSMEIVPVTSISPQDAVQSLEALMGKMSLIKDSAIKNNLAYIPLQSFGGVLILAQTPELLRTARQWLTALDVQSEEAGENIHVYFVQNGLAKDIGDILTQIFGLSAPGGGRLDQQIVSSARQPSSSWGARPFERETFGTSSRSSVFGSSSRSSRSTSTGSSFGTSTTGQSLSGGTGTGATSGSRASMLQRRGGAAAGRVTAGVTGGLEGAQALGLTGEAMIIADEVNNAIIARANAMDWARIKKTIETLDIVPRAVLIEVMVAEVTLNKDLQYGVQWFFKDAEIYKGVTSGSFQKAFSTDLTDKALAGTITNGLALSWVSNARDIATLIQLLSEKTKVKILSTPTILATDNQEASITVGGREPVPTGTAIGASGTTDAIISSISYEETGVILNVTPHINAGGLVRLELEQTIRNTGDSVTVGDNNTAPRFDERNIRTTLLAQNGSTVVIGGIIQQKLQETKDGIPGLQNVPILGSLFANTSKSNDRTELIIAITPHVVDQRENNTTREFLRRLKDLKIRAEQGRT